MSKYKLSDSGVLDTETGACIPPTTDNRHWRAYQKWLADGNTPDPEYTQPELDEQAIQAEVIDLRLDMKKADVWLFRMLLEMFDVGVAKGLWAASDFDPVLRMKAAAWKTKLSRLLELGDN